ncbi:tRNA wybutosine-synthesizing protein, partial [Piptocephalis cylindrospora]
QDDFDARKRHILSTITPDAGPDRSPKGYVDAPLLPLLELINAQADYVSTSSCSGRVVVYADPEPKRSAETEDEEGLEGDVEAQPEKGGRWLLVSHDPLEEMDEETDEALSTRLFGGQTLLDPSSESPVDISHDSPLVYFKFEPMILHVQARKLEDAAMLASLGMSAGFRNSGILTSVSNHKRHMVQLRLTLKLDVPIGIQYPQGIQTLVTPAYLRGLVRLGNARFRDNFDRIDRLYRVV